MSESVWRLGQVLKEATTFLESRHVENARLNAERLLAHVLGLSRIDLYLQFDKPLSPEEREAYKKQLRRRGGHEPLQYILGETEFMSLPFIVTPDVLIPRPETEILVEKVVERFQSASSPTFLDVGTGSGSIAVSLAHFIPTARVTAVDVSEKALRVASSNAEKNGVADRIQFLIRDVQNSGKETDFTGAFDAVVSNPPYVALAEWEGLPEEIRGHEPRIALCDEGNGLTFYRCIAAQASRWLKPDGKIYLEAGDGQAESVQAIFEKEGYRPEGVYPDLNGIKRVLSFGVPLGDQEK